MVYDHGDVEQLAWRLRNADGRAALIVTEGVFALDGDVAPLEAIAALAHRFDVRADGRARRTGSAPSGRTGAARSPPPGSRGQVDVIVGSLGTALGAAGGYAACDRMLARYLAAHARTFAGSTALPPPAAAAAMAALELLREQPRRVEKLQANADCLRTELAREGFDVAGADAHVISIVVGEPRLARPDRRAGARAGRLHRRGAAARRGRGLRAAAAVGDGLAHEVGAARRRPGARPGGAARRLPARHGHPAGRGGIAPGASVG